MDLLLGTRLKNAFNAFVMNKDPTNFRVNYGGGGYGLRPDRPRFSRGNEKSIITSVYNRMAIDVASVTIHHVRLDDSDRYTQDMFSGLNDILSLEANIDQTSRAFLQDIAMSMMDEGVVGVLPIDTSDDPRKTNSYDIYSMRTAKILEWRPQHVRVQVYNDRTGNKEELWIAKKNIAIIENPFFSVMNEPNSTAQRLMRKLALLDVTDEKTASGKLDIIFQLPYAVKTDMKRAQAEQRRKDLEDQVRNSPLGIAYIDSTEKITQLNRSLENNLLKQIEYLTNLLFSQLGITQSILDGTADEKTMLNYTNRTIEPIISAIVDEFKRKFLTKTARSQKQSIKYFRDPFRLVPVNDIAEIADKFTRNEIMTANEIRQVIGMKPVDDPKADMLINSNISQSEEQLEQMYGDGDYENEDYDE